MTSSGLTRTKNQVSAPLNQRRERSWTSFESIEPTYSKKSVATGGGNEVEAVNKVEDQFVYLIEQTIKDITLISKDLEMLTQGEKEGPYTKIAQRLKFQVDILNRNTVKGWIDDHMYIK